MTAPQSWTVDWLPDLTGRTAVVTGASSGLGQATAGALAGAGAHVVLAVRDTVKGARVANALPGSTEVRALELGDLASVRAFAAQWSGDIDLLINNAGIMAVPQGRTVDGFELQIGTNHLGHFALTNLLLPHLTGRVVTVSSGLARLGRLDPADLNWDKRPYKPMRAYATSKLANLLFTTELQRRLTWAGSEVRAMAAHPGVAATSLDRHIGGLQSAITTFGYRFIAQKKLEYGALPTLFAAVEDVPGDSYVGPDGRKGKLPKIDHRSKISADPQLAIELWNVSAELTGTTQPA
ncbi:MAG: oxidoreductase [Nakamurella sp.]